MGFSITSTWLATVIIGNYSATIALNRESDYDYDVYWYDADIAINAVIVILGVVEFIIGILAAVCVSLMKPCTCCCNAPPKQVRFLDNNININNNNSNSDERKDEDFNLTFVNRRSLL